LALALVASEISSELQPASSKPAASNADATSAPASDRTINAELRTPTRKLATPIIAFKP
jgi:hypothetical protein